MGNKGGVVMSVRIRPAVKAFLEAFYNSSPPGNNASQRGFHEENPVEQYKIIKSTCLFDRSWYLLNNIDVARSGMDPVTHFINNGSAEGRDPGPFFSTTYYRSQSSVTDLNDLNALIHFLKHGVKHRLNPNEFFDIDWYLNMYRDVDGAGLNPLEHYAQYGEAEGRRPNENFDPIYYKTQYLQDSPETTSPLLHFMQVGKHLRLKTQIDPVEEYQAQIGKEEYLLKEQIPEILAHINIMHVKPHFIVYTQSDADEHSAGLLSQIYRNWTICKTKSHLDSLVKENGTDPRFIIWLDNSDCLHYTALYRFACAYIRDVSTEIIYGDDDVIDRFGQRSDPFYKPDWSPEYLESCNYIGSSCCVKVSFAKGFILSAESQYDFLLRAAQSAANVAHVRKVLVHRHSALDAPVSKATQKQDVAALSAYVDRANWNCSIHAPHAGLSCYEFISPPEIHLPVSIVIPTAGNDAFIGGKTVTLVTNLIRLIRERPSYNVLEIIVVYNDDMPLRLRNELSELNVRTILYPYAEVNIAKKVNLGASVATGEYLLLMNDDIEPLSSDWIESLIFPFKNPRVGVVGAKLLYADRKIQHAGVVLNSGNPDHVRSRFQRDDLGYFFSTAASRNFIAVTGAVMMTPKLLFSQVGGFTENLAISYNDIDYCLKAYQRGRSSVYCARAELVHYESLSRKRILDMSEAYYFHQTWGHIATDPFYNEEHLSHTPPTFHVHYSGKPIG